MSYLEEANLFKIIVQCKPMKIGRRTITQVSYPPSGHKLYTRDEARQALERFKIRGLEAYAESPNERFDLN